MEEKKCLECGIEIIGRVDKKFCSDQCRNTYNNRTNLISNSYIRKVNHIIRKNRKIMEDLLNNSEKDAIKINKRKLLDLGFNFDYYTNVYKTKNGNYYYFNYEYGFMKIDEDYFTIVKREEFLAK
jgi:hypothetical protein